MLFFFKSYYLFLTALGCHCCTQTISSCGEPGGGCSLDAVRRLLIVEASLVADHGLRACRLPQLRLPGSRAQAQ